MTIATQSFASSGIFLNLSSAKKLAGDIKYYKESKITDDLHISLLEEKTNKLTLLSDQYKTKTELLEKDKLILKTRGDQFEKEFTTCTDSLVKCNESKPSRFVWFGVGFISAVVLGIASAFTLSK